MKKLFFVMLALLAMVAFVGGVSAAEKVSTVHGKVDAYEPGKMLKLYAPGYTGSVDFSGDEPKPEVAKGDWVFNITSNTKVTGDIKQGSKVTVKYTGKVGAGEMTAVSISQIGKKK